MTSIIIIGGGIIGTLLARELAKYKLTVTLIEKEIDIAFGSTKANSGIIHAGYDDSPHTMKYHEGTIMCPRKHALADARSTTPHSFHSTWIPCYRNSC
jgi:glycine/D-amino acid oxidase-like deaminating enzyme